MVPFVLSKTSFLHRQSPNPKIHHPLLSLLFSSLFHSHTRTTATTCVGTGCRTAGHRRAHGWCRNPRSESAFGVFTRWNGFCSLAAAELLEQRTSDGMTVDDIVAKGWAVMEEGTGDWKSQAASIAQSIQLIRKRMQWKKILIRLDQLSVALNKSDLWDEPVYAGKISREHGMLMGKIKEVSGFERELLDHIDMLKLAREENDINLESEVMEANTDFIEVVLVEKQEEQAASLEHSWFHHELQELVASGTSASCLRPASTRNKSA